MRKILFSLLAVLFSAVNVNAQNEVVDGYIEFSGYSSIDEVQFINAWNKTGVTLKDGCLYYQSDEATANAWDIQYGLLPGMEIKADIKYTVEIELRGEPAGNIFNWSMGGVEHYGQLSYGTEFSTYKSEITPIQDDNKIFLQHGNIVGELWIKSIKVWHSATDEVEPNWQNLLVNGDAEGNYADYPCVMQKSTIGGEPGAIVPAKVAVEDGNRYFAIVAGNKIDQPWDNQLWIQSPVEFSKGDLVKVSFRYKAAKAAKASTQQHKEPGAYVHWAAIGDVNFTTEWQSFEGKFSAEADNVYTIAFNLNELAEANVYMLDDVQIIVDANKIKVPTQGEGVAPEVIEIPSENMLLALVDKAEVEALFKELTELSRGNEEYFTPDDIDAWTSLTNIYEMLISQALTEAEEAGSVYESKLTNYKENLKNIIATVKGKLEGTIALYAENGVVGSGADIDKNMPFYNTPVNVEVYANKVVLKGWDGVEGSDLNVYFTSVMTANEDEDVEPQLAISGIEQTVNGEVVSEVDVIGEGETIVRLQPQSEAYPMAAILVANEMTGIMLGEGAGAISLYGMWQPASNGGDEFDNMGVAESIYAAYMVTWPGEPVQASLTLAELAATPATGEGVEVKVNLEDAKVTAAFDMEDYIIAFIEEEDWDNFQFPAIQIAGAEIEAGKALTGTVKGTWADYGSGTGPVLMITENNTEAVDADVTEGLYINEPFEIAENVNHLVTIINSKACPINVDEYGAVIGSFDEPDAIVNDIFYTLPEDYEYPTAIESITGIVIDMMGMKILVPRSADDIVAATPVEEPLYTTSNSKVCKNADWEAYGYTFLAEERDGVAVEVYDGYIVVRGFEGVEGYDLKMALDAEGNATDIKIINNGVESDPTVDYVWGGKSWWYAYLEGYSYAHSDSETESGYLIVCAYDYTNDKYGYYNIEWSKDIPTGINNAIVNVENGTRFNLAGQKVDANFKGIVIKNGKKVMIK